MAGGRIEGAGLRGIMRLTWLRITWRTSWTTARPTSPPARGPGWPAKNHGLALGGDVDNATLRRLSTHGEIVDLIWEPRGELVAEHGQLLQAAIQAGQDGKPKTGRNCGSRSRRSGRWPGQLTMRRSNSCRTRASAGSRRSSPSAGWSPPSSTTVAQHGLPHPHVHNIVITALTTGAC